MHTYRPPTLSMNKKAIGAVAAIAIGLTGCGSRTKEDEFTFKRPIRIPNNAIYLGTVSDDVSKYGDPTDQYTAGVGRAFKVKDADAAFVDCGEAEWQFPDRGTFEVNIDREVTGLPDGATQVTCHGTGIGGFPIETFPSRAPQF